MSPLAQIINVGDGFHPYWPGGRLWNELFSWKFKKGLRDLISIVGETGFDCESGKSQWEFRSGDKAEMWTPSKKAGRKRGWYSGITKSISLYQIHHCQMKDLGCPWSEHLGLNKYLYPTPASLLMPDPGPMLPGDRTFFCGTWCVSQKNGWGSAWVRLQNTRRFESPLLSLFADSAGAEPQPTYKIWMPFSLFTRRGHPISKIRRRVLKAGTSSSDDSLNMSPLQGGNRMIL